MYTVPSTTFFHLPQAKREKLLQCARDEFSRVPFDEASINRIVHQAEISRGSFYMYTSQTKRTCSAICCSAIWTI